MPVDHCLYCRSKNIRWKNGLESANVNVAFEFGLCRKHKSLPKKEVWKRAAKELRKLEEASLRSG